MGGGRPKVQQREVTCSAVGRVTSREPNGQMAQWPQRRGQESLCGLKWRWQSQEICLCLSNFRRLVIQCTHHHDSLGAQLYLGSRSPHCLQNHPSHSWIHLVTNIFTLEHHLVLLNTNLIDCIHFSSFKLSPLVSKSRVAFLPAFSGSCLRASN